MCTYLYQLDVTNMKKPSFIASYTERIEAQLQHNYSLRMIKTFGGKKHYYWQSALTNYTSVLFVKLR